LNSNSILKTLASTVHQKIFWTSHVPLLRQLEYTIKFDFKLTQYKKIKLKKIQVIKIKIKMKKINKPDKSLHNTITIYSDIPSGVSVTVIL